MELNMQTNKAAALHDGISNQPWKSILLMRTSITPLISADTLPNANSLQSRLDLLLSVITEADDLPAQQARDDARPSSSASSMVPHKTPLQAFLHCKEDFPLYYTQRKKTAVSSPPHVQSLHTKDHALVDGADTTPGTSPGASQSARQRVSDTPGTSTPRKKAASDRSTG
ncbi:hypothetical protein LTR78_004357 [Recurvomyces mirabilis]|uniref:Uncharacterized protein n=1 Tax=Recurvomyces mirabilis TaxID=574656 RepID=A0AAE1C2K6_9PEZI|nr:hypothetical protein LTR78_004357 [Recurvomyces mirabilis]